MIEIFRQGGPVMWPLLIVSIVALATVLERVVFLARETFLRDPKAVAAIFFEAEQGEFEKAEAAGARSRDYVARVLTQALVHRDVSFSNALLHASSLELQRFNRGISVLDTIVTLAPLLGLFGTVTGMIGAFHILKGSELGAPVAITGGVAQALIATAFGLVIAIVALLPFNFLNSRLEQARSEIENAAAHLEMLLLRAEKAQARLDGITGDISLP
jgi:biopolymer transport protein ExbB